MAFTNFSTTDWHRTTGWDSEAYEVTRENPAITTEMEGGYMVSRPRHTRTPRRTVTCGWKSMTDADLSALISFWNARKGSSESFTFRDPGSATLVSGAIDPSTATTFTVRFKAGDGLTYRYVGMGNTKLWDVTVVLEEV